MKWTYEINDERDVEIYDHNGELVTTAENKNTPSISRKRGVPINPDVKGAICSYLCGQIEKEDFPDDSDYHSYIETAQTILASDRIEQRQD